MKNTAIALSCEQNAFRMHSETHCETSSNAFWDIVENAKIKLDHKQIQKADNDYPDVFSFIRDEINLLKNENERIIGEMLETADMGEEIEYLRSQVSELSESSLSHRVDQLDVDLKSSQHQVTELQSTILKIKKAYDSKLEKKQKDYETLYNAYNASQIDCESLREHINNNRGLFTPGIKMRI